MNTIDFNRQPNAFGDESMTVMEKYERLQEEIDLLVEKVSMKVKVELISYSNNLLKVISGRNLTYKKCAEPTLNAAVSQELKYVFLHFNSIRAIIHSQKLSEAKNDIEAMEHQELLTEAIENMEAEDLRMPLHYFVVKDKDKENFKSVFRNNTG